MDTDTNAALPHGWEWESAEFGTIVIESLPGFASGERDPEGVMQVRMNNLDTKGNWIWDKTIRVPKDDALINKYKLLVGDIVFNNTNSTELVGKSAVFQGHDEPVVYSNHFNRIRLNSKAAVSEYVSHWLRNEWNKGTFERICQKWIGQSAVRNEKLHALMIPLPPIAEQQKIAAALTEQMAHVETARRALLAQIAAVNELPAALLRAVFDHPADGSRTVALSEVCRQDRKTVSPDSAEATTLPYLGLENIESDTGRLL